MDMIEKIGLMTVKDWNEKRGGRDGEFNGVYPSDIGVTGPIKVGDVSLLMMACDEHMESEQGSDEPIYTLARRHDYLAARIEHMERAQIRGGHEAKYNESAKAERRNRINGMHEEMRQLRADGNFALSVTYNRCRDWFIENATWTEVP